VPYFTTSVAAEAASMGIALRDGSPLRVNALQDLHAAYLR
jgi:hypothetical protein